MTRVSGVTITLWAVSTNVTNFTTSETRSSLLITISILDNIDAIIEDFNRQATRRSHMDRHSADHQDPPAGDGGGNPSSGGANRNVRRPGNRKDDNACNDSGKSNVSTDSGGVNASDIPWFVEHLRTKRQKSSPHLPLS